MEQLKAKLKKQGGFTMVELLIVVAIIAILVAVSIPMMNTALERSRHAVDQANVRDAIALASVEYLSDPEAFKNADGTAKTNTYVYIVGDDDHQGYLDTTGTGVLPKCTCGAPTTGLQVKVAPGTGTDKKPKIATSWIYDTATKKTIDNSTAFNAIT